MKETKTKLLKQLAIVLIVITLFGSISLYKGKSKSPPNDVDIEHIPVWHIPPSNELNKLTGEAIEIEILKDGNAIRVNNIEGDDVVITRAQSEKQVNRYYDVTEDNFKVTFSDEEIAILFRSGKKIEIRKY